LSRRPGRLLEAGRQATPRGGSASGPKGLPLSRRDPWAVASFNWLPSWVPRGKGRAYGETPRGETFFASGGSIRPCFQRVAHHPFQPATKASSARRRGGGQDAGRSAIGSARIPRPPALASSQGDRWGRARSELSSRVLPNPGIGEPPTGGTARVPFLTFTRPRASRRGPDRKEIFASFREKKARRGGALTPKKHRPGKTA